MQDDSEQQQPIIIKKISGGHGGHHGGSWKVAFADFMTAMMAFFLVLWLVGQEPEVKRAVAGYFTDPVGFNRGGKVGSGEGAGLLKGKTGVSDKESLQAIVRKHMADAAQSIKQQLMVSEDFKALRNNVLIEMTADGLRIQIVEGGDSSFFESGSARMSPTGEAVLSLVSQEVKKLPNRMVFEGHTDATGSQNQFGYSNWDLGADRANFCRKVALKNGIRPSQIKEVRSLADTHPLNVDDPKDPRNRRVSILVLNDFDYLIENEYIESVEGEDGPEYSVVDPNDPNRDKPSDTEGEKNPESSESDLEEDGINEDEFEVPDYLLDDGQ